MGRHSVRDLAILTGYSALTIRSQMVGTASRWREEFRPVNWTCYPPGAAQRLPEWTGKPASLEQMIAGSQEYQPFVLKYHTEFVPVTGACPERRTVLPVPRLLAGGVTESVVD